ncbi:MAG TPA: hypothetical protein VFK89_09275 [Actinomycetota bacterium]|nr:hypothetical protein [Actinomycetota bacterium]
MRLRRFAALAVALATVIAVAGVPGVSTAAPCGDATVPLRTFKVVSKWVKKSYAIGETAKLKVNVTRLADQDPVTSDGIDWPTGRPMDEPAPDVSVGVGMMVGDVYLTGGAITDADGNAVVKVPIADYTKPGKGNSRIYAEKIAIKDFPSSACRVVIKEFGYVDPGPGLTITK